jgi:hypothetical protein
MLLITAAIYAQNDASLEVSVTFHNFPWGTSIQAFTSRMGNPAYVEEVNGLRSLVYDKIEFSGYQVFLIAYFSQSGLEGGTYYFDTLSYEERIQCYTNIRKELLERYGSTILNDTLFREMAPYESSWNLPSGYVHLKVDTRRNDPVTLWYSSPALTRTLFGS